MKLIFASNNAHKLAEVRAMMPPYVEVLSLRDIGFLGEIAETGTTLEENSLIKAKAVGMDGVFADDTGLEIDELKGAPGVYTARWAGGTDADNRAKALDELKGKTNRKARFRTVITLIKDGKTIVCEGIVRGHIATEERGGRGFGYDSIFIPEGYNKTFAELPAEVKNSISHRARAIEALCKIIG